MFNFLFYVFDVKHSCPPSFPPSCPPSPPASPKGLKMITHVANYNIGLHNVAQS